MSLSKLLSDTNQNILFLPTFSLDYAKQRGISETNNVLNQDKTSQKQKFSRKQCMDYSKNILFKYNKPDVNTITT